MILLAACFFGVLTPLAFAAADNALVQCGRSDGSVVLTPTETKALIDQCNFTTAVEMINRLINYAIIISMPLAAIAFAYAGWLRLSAGDNPSQIEKSNKVFMSVGIGILVMLSGWLVFHLIATTFLSSDYAKSTYLK